MRTIFLLVAAAFLFVGCGSKEIVIKKEFVPGTKYPFSKIDLKGAYYEIQNYNSTKNIPIAFSKKFFIIEKELRAKICYEPMNEIKDIYKSIINEYELQFEEYEKTYFKHIKDVKELNNEKD